MDPRRVLPLALPLSLATYLLTLTNHRDLPPVPTERTAGAKAQTTATPEEVFSALHNFSMTLEKGHRYNLDCDEKAKKLERDRTSRSLPFQAVRSAPPLRQQASSHVLLREVGRVIV